MGEFCSLFGTKIGKMVENDHNFGILSNKKTYYNIKKVALSKGYLLDLTVVER